MAQYNSEFNETDFIEYDPTPYGGGYDIAATYGAPLAPSDSICYPHSLSKPNSSKPPNGSSNGAPVTHPNGKGEVGQATKSGIDQARPGEDDEEEKSRSDSNGYWLVDPNFAHSGDDVFSNGYGVCDSGYGFDYGNPDSDYYPWSGCGYGCGGQKAHSQFGYSRDDLGPCAALFDYWPCLYRKDKMSYCHSDEVENFCGNQWEAAADYLFGGWNPHGERRDEVVSYGCRKHYTEQPISVLYDYNEELWSQKMSQCEVYHNGWHYPNQPVSVQYDCNEKSWSRMNHCEVYYEERHNEQPISVQCDYNEESWPQNTNHYEVYLEEPYLQPNYGEDWYGGYDEHFH